MPIHASAKIIPFPKSRRPPVSEYYVHAVLQAARAYHLGLDLGSAKSWGLNRAIFYEAAKKGYITRGGPKPHAGTGARPGRFKRANFGVLYAVGGEKAYAVKPRAGGIRFVIGGKVQSPDLFDRQIKKRFPQWELVWSDALQLIEGAPERTLRSASMFHRDIYKRYREVLRALWPNGETRPVEADEKKAA